MLRAFRMTTEDGDEEKQAQRIGELAISRSLAVVLVAEAETFLQEQETK